ncbi:MAG: enoyl-ACP reductase FabI [Acidimicrobiales bacterium]
MLRGKKLLITGVVTPESIAYGVARAALLQRAEIVLTAPPRDLAASRETAAGLPVDVDVLAVDVNDPDDLAALTVALRERWGHLDGALHAVAFGPRDALDGSFLDVDIARLSVAFQTSAASYAGLARVLADLAPRRGASLVGLDFDAGGGAWPTYNWMGVCKQALESVSRYVARDLGPRGIRSNLVAAGPLVTRAASGIPGFQKLLDAWERQSPMPWDPEDPTPVADTVCFLLSDLARAITGEILHVDGGFHAMATGLDGAVAADALPAATDDTSVAAPTAG